MIKRLGLISILMATLVTVLAEPSFAPAADGQALSRHWAAEGESVARVERKEETERKEKQQRLEDSYAIYSLLLPGQILSALGAGRAQTWAIAATSINAEDINPALAPEAMLKPPPQHADWFHEAVADYNARKNQRTVFTRRFHLDHPYVLLSPEEVAQFRQERGSVHANPALARKFQGIPGITYLSEVYFNRAQTAALVYRLDWCGNLCAQSQWFYFEKSAGVWTRRSGPGSG